MKALILAAGRGARLASATAGGNKCLLEVDGRPVIMHSLANAAAAGATSAVLVIGHRGEEIRAAVGERAQGLDVRYVTQDHPTGVVDAMACARDALEGDDFLLFFADELMEGARHRALVDRFRAEGLFVMVGVVREDDPAEIRKTYAVATDPATGLVTRLIEKPDHPEPGVRGTGNCVFRGAIFDYLAATPVNPRRGEREFPDLIQGAIDDGRPVKADVVCARYVNLNTPEDLAAAQRGFGRR